ncbi:uncharacterized protein [Ptychodera flava]|uniref:uncharacterized protein n=1 Tax=Ptychodera flava TaxID=63121 RepID=UPI00396A4B87
MPTLLIYLVALNIQFHFRLTFTKDTIAQTKVNQGQQQLDSMDGVLNDRPVAPSYDESFQYDTLNGTLTSTSTYHINASISVASITESPPSTDTNGKTHNFDRSSANIIKGASENVPLLSLEDILISPPTPDDNSSTTDIEQIDGNFLDRTSENLRSPNDSSNGVNTYATLRFVSAAGGDVGVDTQQASSSSDETSSMPQQMCGETEESERLQHMLAGGDNSGVQYEDGNITSLQDISLMEDRVGMIDTFEINLERFLISKSPLVSIPASLIPTNCQKSKMRGMSL